MMALDMDSAKWESVAEWVTTHDLPYERQAWQEIARTIADDAEGDDVQ